MDRIALGSGKLYCVLYSGTIPNDATIETADNMLGAVKGGASIEYKATTYKAVDDSGKRSKTIVTDEEAVLKGGIMTWNGQTLRKLAATARVTESNGKRTVKIGGIANQNNEKYVIRFLHEDSVDGNCRLTIVGTNQAGLTIAFAKDKETVINPEFSAMPSDSDGTLIIYEEDIIPEQSLTLTSVAGTLTGDTAVTVSPTIGANNSYKYKVGQFLASPKAGDALTGYTAWDGDDDITAPTGYILCIAEVNTSGTCVKFGTVTVTAKA